MKKLTILIICGYKLRDIESLQYLKRQLEKKLKAKVYIVGGLSELQKMYYYLYTIRPDVVFIPQVLEKSCRRLAEYVLASNALLYVIPAEITVITVIEQLLLNPDISYNDHLTKFLIPGKRYEKLLMSSDIHKDKVAIVGSPKIDCLVNEEGSQFLSRKDFCKKIGANPRKKNVFIFTSFVRANEDYLRADDFFKNTLDEMLKSNVCVDKTKVKYLQIIAKLCKDFNDYNIIVKPHPLEDAEVYRQQNGDNYYLITDTSLYSCINSIDLAIHWSSTVSTECWIKNIPTIQLAPFEKYDRFLSESHPGNPIVRTYEDLSNSIHIYLNKKLEGKYLQFQKNYIKNNFFKLDGNSAGRIVNIIKTDIKAKSLQVKFLPKFSWLIYVVLFFEKIFGYVIAHRLIALVDSNYDWKAAIENKIYQE